ncbi:hypothetical protein ACX801_17940 [Arthrobacter bambusae]
MNQKAPATQTPISAARPARVSWGDGENRSQIFTAAHVPAERWNGWAKPYFSQHECERLAATQADFNDSLKFEYDPDRKVWQEFNAEEDYREDCRAMIVHGETCHQIGSGFTWLELPDEPRHVVYDTTPNPIIRKVRARARPAGKNSNPGPAAEYSQVVTNPGAVDPVCGPDL